MPLACIRVGDPKAGNSSWYLVAFIGVDYDKFSCFIDALLVNKTRTSKISKLDIAVLVGLAQSDRERELIKCSIFTASGLTPTAAHRNFGFDCMNERSKRLQSVIEETRKIRESIDVLAATEDKAILSAMGIVLSDSKSDSETDTDTISLDPCGKSEILPSLWLDIPSFDCLQQYWKPPPTIGLR